METDECLWLSKDNSRVVYINYTISSDHHQVPDYAVPDAVSVEVVQLADLKTWPVIAPTVTRNTRVQHVSSLTWVTRDLLCINWLDTLQSAIFFTMCPFDDEAESYICKIVSLINNLTKEN